MYHEYDRWTGDVDIKRRRRRFFSRIWTRSRLIHGDPKFGQGLGYVAALQVKCLRVYGWVWLSCQLATCITDTTYALATEWWFLYQPATSPFNTKHTYRCVCVNVFKFVNCHYCRHSSEIEEQAQRAIDTFFSSNMIVPSPWTDSSKRKPFKLPETPGNLFSVIWIIIAAPYCS